jgi:hypothetical protein
VSVRVNATVGEREQARGPGVTHIPGYACFSIVLVAGAVERGGGRGMLCVCVCVCGTGGGGGFVLCDALEGRRYTCKGLYYQHSNIMSMNRSDISVVQF